MSTAASTPGVPLVECRAGASRSSTLFFYDGSLSRPWPSVAHGQRHAAAEFKRYSTSLRAELVSVCTDGETYGHHEKFADLGLAHLLYEAAPPKACRSATAGICPNTRRRGKRVAAGPQGLGTRELRARLGALVRRLPLRCCRGARRDGANRCARPSTGCATGLRISKARQRHLQRP